MLPDAWEEKDGGAFFGQKKRRKRGGEKCPHVPTGEEALFSPSHPSSPPLSGHFNPRNGKMGPGNHFPLRDAPPSFAWETKAIKNRSCWHKESKSRITRGRRRRKRRRRRRTEKCFLPPLQRIQESLPAAQCPPPPGRGTPKTAPPSIFPPPPFSFSLSLSYEPSVPFLEVEEMEGRRLLLL